ncbi:MAG: ABC transporter substrate-binding protein [Rhizobium sp.]|nr:ABC transporter substrate-binding protein [Rhizobium sp.]
MRAMIMTAVCFAATGLGTVSAADLRMSWWGSEDRHTATHEALKVCGDKFGHTISPEFTGWTGHQEKIATQLAGRTEADIMQINWPWLPLFSKSGDGFADLNQFRDVIDLGQWSDAYLRSGSVDGKLNGLPVSTTGRVFMFNKTTYDKAGLAIPATWDDLFAAAPVMKEKLGQDYYPFEGTGLDARLVVILRTTQKTGKDLIDPATKQVVWTMQELAEGLDFYQTMVDRGVVKSWKDVAAGGNAPLHEDPEWASGKIAGTYQWSSIYGKIAGPMEEGQQLVPVKLLQVDSATTQGVYRKPSMLFAISKNSKTPKAAAEILNCLLNDPEAVAILGATRGVPSSKIALEELTKAGSIEPVQIEANRIVLESTGVGVSPLNEHPRVADIFDTTFEAFAYGQMSAERAAAEIIEGINGILTGI